MQRTYVRAQNTSFIYIFTFAHEGHFARQLFAQEKNASNQLFDFSIDFNRITH